MMLTLIYSTDKGQDVIGIFCRTVMKTRWGQLKCWQHCLWDGEWDGDERKSDEEKQEKEKTGSVCVMSGCRTNSDVCVCLLLPGLDLSEWPLFLTLTLFLSSSLSWSLFLSLPSSLSVLFQAKYPFSRGSVVVSVRGLWAVTETCPNYIFTVI